MSKYIIKKEILDENDKFIAYKYYLRTVDNIPEWTDDKSISKKFYSPKDALQAIESMRFFVLSRMSVEEIK